MIKKILILLLIVMSINTVDAQIVNGDFEIGNFTGWTVVETLCGDNNPRIITTDGGAEGTTYYCLFYECVGNTGEGYIAQNVDITNYDGISFYLRDIVGARFKVYVGGSEIYSTTTAAGWGSKITVDLPLGLTGIQEIKFHFNALLSSAPSEALDIDQIELVTYSYITLNFKDNCNNLIRKTAGTYYNADDPISLNFYSPTGSYNILFVNQDYLELWVDSSMGTLYYNISNPKDDIDYTILNPTISWNNNILVQDGNTSLPISNALVMFSQDCIIDPSVFPSRNKFTDSNGFANFEQCELDSFFIAVNADNYKSFSGNILSSSMDAFILSQTIIINLYPVGDEGNESEYNYTDYNTWIKFKDTNGNYTTSILDTDNYVDLYYFNNNSDSESMTLKFQKYSIETGIIDLLSWNIPIGTNGYKRIFKSNYTDTSYIYIGYLYNYAIDGWDKIEYLDVRNETSEIDLDYQNLTAFTWFINKNPEGSIDYRENIEIIGYANTTYVGLFVISLELYDNGLYVDHINLTWADFIGADLKYFYEWNPVYSYINGHNYTVRMHGYDYYLLDMDYINATDYRKNKLTICVKDQLGNNLVNSFIFLDDYGSLSTGISHFNSYEDLEDGYYRYKASKSGYDASGWDDITLSGADKIVTYTLTSVTDEGNIQPLKTDDNELKNLYIMLMSFLLIFILFGGFMYVIK